MNVFLPKLLLLSELHDGCAVVSEAVSLASSKMVTHMFIGASGKLSTDAENKTVESEIQYELHRCILLK